MVGEVTERGASVGISADVAALEVEEEFPAALVPTTSSQAAEGSRQLKGVSHACSSLSTHVHSQQSPPSHSQSCGPFSATTGQ